jgi:hypothetical protein
VRLSLEITPQSAIRSRKKELSLALKRTELLKLARAGAEARLRQLTEEIDQIRRTFPDLGRGRRQAAAEDTAGRRRPGVRGWTSAQRKAAAERMRKYWASRKGKK